MLGFGDRSFAQYCAFAQTVDAALADKGSLPMLGLDTVDRQSSQDFAHWGRRLGDALGIALALSHAPVRPATRPLRLVEAAGGRGWFGLGRRLPRFAVGDLIGITPPGSNVPRYYSIASAGREGVLEICIRKLAGGRCSEFLHAVQPGDQIEGFIRQNPDFRPVGGRKPLIFIGAGTGIAPLAGFVRNNRPGRPAYLFFGARDPASDFLYEGAFRAALDERRLTSLETAFSRVVGGQYVQQKLASRAELLRGLIDAGAHVLVCGSLDMARDVRTTLDAVLAPLALSTAELKSQGRYLEDAY